MNNQQAPDYSNVVLVYILYLASIVVGITGIIGLIIAYVKKGKADEIAYGHYRFQIRTFWIGFLYMVIGALLSVVLIGYLILLFVAVWYIIRCVKGLLAANREEPIKNVTTWMF